MIVGGARLPAAALPVHHRFRPVRARNARMNKPPPAARPAEAGAAAPPAASPLALSRLLARAPRALAFAPAAAFLLMVLAPPLNHDAAAILNFAERWVGGERLYRELIDVNPPLIFVLTAMPALLAKWSPLDGVQAYLLCVLGLCLAAWRLTSRLRGSRAEGRVERAVLDALVPLAILLPAYDVGQREHLMAVFAIPYAFLAARRIEGLPTPPRLAWTVSIAAAFGFALKPHFLAVPLLVEALVLLRRGPAAAFRDPLPWGMAAVWLLYLASLPVFFPAYLDVVMPLIIGFYLGNGGIGLFDVLLTPLVGTAALTLLALAPFALWSGAGAAAQALLAVGLGGALSAWVQHKGWSYHVVPMAMASALLAGLLAARWLDRALVPARAAASAPGFALAFAVAIGLVHVRGESPWRQIWYLALRDGELATVLRREVAGERLLVLSPDIYPVYPALNYARARSTLRTMNLWLLVGAYPDCPDGAPRYRETWEMSRPEFLVYRTVAEDFARAPPTGVLVAKNPGIPRCGDQEFDPIAYFGRHPAFAETWQRYSRTVHMDTYVLHLRED
jgi:hypothetical protein